MPNLAIIVGSIGAQAGQLHLSGVALAEPGVEFSWGTDVAWGSNPVIVGVVIRQAARDAAAAEGITVLPSDQQTIYGGPSIN